jgi:hypothetical protein
VLIEAAAVKLVIRTAVIAIGIGVLGYILFIAAWMAPTW